MTQQHWHVAHGQEGYGPDGANGFSTAVDLPAVADLIRDELSTFMDMAHQDAEISAENGDYEQAWKFHKLESRLDIISRNFDNGRQYAPLYRGNPEAWHATIAKMIEAEFPLDVSLKTTRLYVWQCTEPDCDHYAEWAETDDDELSQCRTEGCDGDPNDGEGWDGYCGSCADRKEPDAEHPADCQFCAAGEGMIHAYEPSEAS